MPAAGHTQSLLVAAVLAFSAVPAHAQDLNQGKTPPQLFAAGCAACHPSPRGLGRQLGAASLVTFLRQHYTTSREQAAVLAAYVGSFTNQPPGTAQRPREPRQEAQEQIPASRRHSQSQEERAPAARRRAPTEDGRPEQQTTAPAGLRQPRAPESRAPTRPRQPAEAAVSAERPVSAAAPESAIPEQPSADASTSAIPSMPEPSTQRVDDIAD
jgi:hypothetical protein